MTAHDPRWGTGRPDEASEADVVDQATPAVAEDVEDTTGEAIHVPTEANPADVWDQSQSVPTSEDDEHEDEDA